MLSLTQVRVHTQTHHTHTHMCSRSWVHLICGCNLILDLRNQLTRLGFQAFVSPPTLLFKGRVSKVCACVHGMLLFAEVIVQLLWDTLCAISTHNTVNQVLYSNLHHFALLWVWGLGAPIYLETSVQCLVTANRCLLKKVIVRYPAEPLNHIVWQPRHVWVTGMWGEAELKLDNIPSRSF